MARRVRETRFMDGKRRREVTELMWPKAGLTPLLISKDWESVYVQFSHGRSDLDHLLEEPFRELHEAADGGRREGTGRGQGGTEGEEAR